MLKEVLSQIMIAMLSNFWNTKSTHKQQKKRKIIKTWKNHIQKKLAYHKNILKECSRGILYHPETIENS